jgi:nicotinate-nucleotide pyrophosphorylase (carboxylating)
MEVDNQYLKNFITLAITEDVGDGDHTSLSTIPADKTGKARLICKQDGVLCGVEVAREVFAQIDNRLKMDTLLQDGARIKNGDVAFYVEGPVISLLQAERLVLNFMQRLSGVATQTAIYADKLKDYKTKVLDTRKTTPGMRLLEKYAVKIGGGVNHRIGLYDMILIKDNHIDFAGGIEKAIDKANIYSKEKNKSLKVEVEVRSIDDVNRVLAHGGVFRIMLDNFTPSQTLEAVKLINGRYETESSGGITLDNLTDYAACGVDYISVGALTHQIKSLDMSLKAIDF